MQILLRKCITDDIFEAETRDRGFGKVLAGPGRAHAHVLFQVVDHVAQLLERRRVRLDDVLVAVAGRLPIFRVFHLQTIRHIVDSLRRLLSEKHLFIGRRRETRGVICHIPRSLIVARHAGSRS